jgi:hypothetical protein
MTGRRLYDALTDAWAQENYNRNDREWLKGLPPAWPFLHSYERRSFSVAASKLTPKKRSA